MSAPYAEILPVADPPTASLMRPALRRPLVGLAAAFVAGIGIGRLTEIDPAPALVVVAFALALACVLRSRLGSAGVLAACAAAGWARQELDDAGAMARDLRRLAPAPRAFIEVIGTIRSDPEFEPTAAGGRWRFRAAVEGLSRTGAWDRCAGEIEVRWPDQGTTPPVYGDRWHWAGLLVRDAESDRPPLLLPRAGGSRRLDEGLGSPLVAWCFRMRAVCGEILSRGIRRDEETVGLLRAMVLNHRVELPRRVSDAFARTGTLHVIAISGSHVVVWAGILSLLLKSMGVGRPRWALAMGPVLAAYTLATGLAPSAVRACIMAVAYWSAYALMRKPDGPSALALAALAILGAVPAQLADRGFVLSFAVVAGLMVFFPPAQALLDRWTRREDWVEAVTGPHPLRERIRRAGVAALASSVAAWIVSTPLTAQFFNLFSPVALVANLIIVPLSALILFTAGLSLLGAAVHPVVPEVFNHANRVIVHTMLRSTDLFAAVPGGHCFVVSPGWAAVAALLAGSVVLIHGPPRGRRLALAVAAAAGGWMAGVAGRADRWSVHALGTGDTYVALVDMPHGGEVVVQAGSLRDAGRVVRFLRSRGVDRVEAFVLSHTRGAWAGGLPRLLEEYPPASVWRPPGPARASGWAEAAASAQRAGAAIRAPTGVTPIAHSGEVTVAVRAVGGASPALLARAAAPGAAVAFSGDGSVTAAVSEAAAPWLFLADARATDDPGPGPVLVRRNGAGRIGGRIGLAEEGGTVHLFFRGGVPWRTQIRTESDGL